LREPLHLDLLVAQAAALIEHADDGLGVYGDRVMQIQRPDSVAKFVSMAIGLIREHHARCDAGFACSPEHP
jgi:hypothetical protein